MCILCLQNFIIIRYTITALFSKKFYVPNAYVFWSKFLRKFSAKFSLLNMIFHPLSLYSVKPSKVKLIKAISIFTKVVFVLFKNYYECSVALRNPPRFYMAAILL